MRGRPKAGGLRSGFSLLELILVMLIICTVLALAAPSLRGFSQARQTSDAAAQLLAFTQLARTLAASDGVPYRLNFEPDDCYYWLTAQKQGAFERLATEYGRDFALPDGASVELLSDGGPTGADYLQFMPDGTHDALTVVLTGRLGERIAVTCPSRTEPFRIVSGGEQ